MLALLKLCLPVAALLGGGCSGGVPAAQQETHAATQEPKLKPKTELKRTDLHLELTAPRRSYQLGEPVTLVASVVNGTEQAVEVDPFLHPEFGFLNVTVTDPAGERRPYRSPVRREGGRGAKARTLAPGERLSDFVPLFFSSDGWFLEQAGTYTVEARYDIGKQTLTAERVSFEVVWPRDETELAAARMWMERQGALSFYNVGGPGAEDVAYLEQLVQRFPDSNVSGYAQLALARYWTRSSYDAKSNGVRPADHEQAARAFEQGLKRVSDPLIWTEGSLELAECYAELGDTRAQAVAERARDRFPALARTHVFDLRVQASPKLERLIPLKE